MTTLSRRFVLVFWVGLGVTAIVPAQVPPVAERRAKVVTEAEPIPAKEKSDLWTFQPALKPAPPSVKNQPWVRNPVDRFILAKLEREQLSPSPEADRRTLIRRLSFDLTGLPPGPEEVRQFVLDRDPLAYEHRVDRLLASPRYGERWARHWLDVVHFGETHGYDKDKPRRNAWPYRDYVIRSFNTDKPYPRFVQEQLAGDVLFPDEPDGVIATGFIAAGPWDYVGHVELPESKTDGLIARYNDRDDMVMTTMSTFQSLTVHCARCHDHKFDPISQREYYALQAVFAGVDRAERTYDPDAATHARRRRLSEEKRLLEEKFTALTNEISRITSPEIAQLDARVAETNQRLATLPKPAGENEHPGSGRTGPPDSGRRKELESEIQSLTRERWRHVFDLADAQQRADWAAVTNRLEELTRESATLPAPQKVYAAASSFTPEGSFVPPGKPRPVHFMRRGDVKRPGELMAPGTVSCVPGMNADLRIEEASEEGNRRAALALWITDPRNHLTRRSIVNRIWHYHFGRGIIDTPNDFGHMGGQPTHPELLDWLAYWFQENGESFKQLHRLILTSATYRQTAAPDTGKEAVDGDNRWLWRMNRKRLDAESVRDAMLSVGGALDLTLYGPSVQQFAFKDDHSPVYDYAAYDLESPGSDRRSIYRFIVRSVTDPFMDTLDCPDPSVLADRRTTTTTALQALTLLNNPFVLRQSERLAQRVRATASTPETQVEAACRLVWNRPPTNEEARQLTGYSGRHGLENLCRLLFNSSEFVFVD